VPSSSEICGGHLDRGPLFSLQQDLKVSNVDPATELVTDIAQVGNLLESERMMYATLRAFGTLSLAVGCNCLLSGTALVPKA
jgi:hypothetical protein